jgi:S-DNA-T family DNA segregation ATPase FtsK/SpoIIIE
VITGNIKANFPARISLAVVSGVDSRVILDQPGAERLIGRGDMLFQAPDEPAPKRIQGVFVSDQEIQRLVRFWREQADPLKKVNQQGAEELPAKSSSTLTEVPSFDDVPALDEDPLFRKALEIIRAENRASISMLQRKLRIGYTRAGRMIDQMIAQKIIGDPLDNTGVRPVLDQEDEPEE